MRVKGIIWVGVAVGDREAATDFFAGRLGLEIESDLPGFSRLVAENGDRVELFGPDSSEHDQLDTGPVAGFWVEDVAEAHAELAASQVDGLTPILSGHDGHRWFYLRAPDGKFYEICEQVAPRPPKGG